MEFVLRDVGTCRPSNGRIITNACFVVFKRSKGKRYHRFYGGFHERTMSYNGKTISHRKIGEILKNIFAPLLEENEVEARM